MREILFRGKPVVPGKYNGGSFAFGYYCCSPSGKHYIELSDTNGCKSPVEVNPDTVGQYTGLTDKNGKKIFEGDIVKATQNRILDIATIFFEHATFMVVPINGKIYEAEEYEYWLNDWDIEVIGNVHDNPEITQNCWR